MFDAGTEVLQLNFYWILVAFIPQMIVMAVCMLFCYIIAKNFKMSKAFTLLGLFGFFGVVALFIITIVKRVKGFSNGNLDVSGGQAYNYGGPENPYQGGNNTNQQTNNYGNFNSASNSYNIENGDAFRTETISSENYKFDGGMNVCESHDDHDDTYTSSYTDVMYEQSTQGQYNLNGEKVSFGKGLCPHCGAKLRKFKRFCDSCGVRV